MYKRQDGQLGIGNKVVQFDGNKKTVTVDDTEYKLSPGLEALIMLKPPRPTQYNNNDYKAYKSLAHLHRPRLNHSQIWQVLLDNTLHGNGSICLGKCLYLGKG